MTKIMNDATGNKANLICFIISLTKMTATPHHNNDTCNMSHINIVSCHSRDN